MKGNQDSYSDFSKFEIPILLAMKIAVFWEEEPLVI